MTDRVAGKTLCEILTAAGAMVATRGWFKGRPQTVPDTAPCGCLFNEEATAPEASRRGSVVVPPPCGPIPTQTLRRLPYADAFQWSASSLT